MQDQQHAAEGNVNFDNGGEVVHQDVQQAGAEVEASAPTGDVTVTLGNVRELGDTPRPVIVRPVVNVHTIGLSISLTLNMGFTLLKGMKELKTIDIERNGQVEKYNFYNPFMRADRDRHTGEGLLRKTLSSIAKIAYNVLGREVVYLGEDESINTTINNLSLTLRDKLAAQFPLNAGDELFSVELEVDGQDQPAIRAVTFGELFAIDTWVTSDVDEDGTLTTHNVHVNIGLNIGGLYDSQEPHSFVRKAAQFLESTVTALGIAENVNYSTNVAFDATTIVEPSVRDMIDLLVGEDGYEVVSKAAVESARVDWAPSSAANKLFGYGCDLMLCSPPAETGEDGEEGAEE